VPFLDQDISVISEDDYNILVASGPESGARLDAEANMNVPSRRPFNVLVRPTRPAE
jgi:hypothetical protein